MINAILQVIDRLIKLKENRDQRFSNLFEDFIKPTFDQMLMIHNDYIAMFSVAGDLISEGYKGILGGNKQNPEAVRAYLSKIDEAEDYLKKQRQVLEPVRVAIRASATVFREWESGPEEINKFATLIWRYFFCDKTLIVYIPDDQKREIDARQGSRSFDLLDSFNYLRENITGEDFSSGINCVGFHLHGVREAWAKICEAYAQIRLAKATR